MSGDQPLTKKEFLKEHPSLNGKVFDFEHSYDPDEEGDSCYIWDVHETQLEKQKVKKIIDDNVEPPLNEKLKKELGLGDK